MPVNPRVLKWIVIILGILIVLGLGVIIITIANRLGNMAEKKEAERLKQAELAATLPMPVEPAWAVTGGTAFPTDVNVPLEAGENISSAQMVPQGLLLVLQRDGQTTGILLVGPDGAVRSRFTITRPE